MGPFQTKEKENDKSSDSQIWFPLMRNQGEKRWVLSYLRRIGGGYGDAELAASVCWLAILSFRSRQVRRLCDNCDREDGEKRQTFDAHGNWICDVRCEVVFFKLLLRLRSGGEMNLILGEVCPSKGNEWFICSPSYGDLGSLINRLQMGKIRNAVVAQAWLYNWKKKA